MPPPPKSKPHLATLCGVKKRHANKPGPRTPEAERRRRERQLSRYNDRIYVFDGKESEELFLGHALILSFELFDLWGPNLAKMVDTFKYLRCSVLTRHIDSRNFKSALEKFLDKRFKKPRLIWITCHGGETSDGLTLYAGPKSDASIRWSELVKSIAPAQVDVLTILSCCHGAAAYMPQLGEGRVYSKELIVLSSWNEYAYPSIFFDPTFAAMKKWFHEAGESRLTEEKLYQYIASGIRHARVTATKQWNDYIDYWEKRRNEGKYIDSKTRMKIAEGKKTLENTKRYYTHPIYTKRLLGGRHGCRSKFGVEGGTIVESVPACPDEQVDSGGKVEGNIENI